VTAVFAGSDFVVHGVDANRLDFEEHFAGAGTVESRNIEDCKS
jgi:hypothetical protein